MHLNRVRILLKVFRSGHFLSSSESNLRTNRSFRISNLAVTDSLVKRKQLKLTHISQVLSKCVRFRYPASFADTHQCQSNTARLQKAYIEPNSTPRNWQMLQTTNRHYCDGWICLDEFEAHDSSCFPIAMCVTRLRVKTPVAFIIVLADGNRCGRTDDCRAPNVSKRSARHHLRRCFEM